MLTIYAKDIIGIGTAPFTIEEDIRTLSPSSFGSSTTHCNFYNFASAEDVLKFLVEAIGKQIAYAQLLKER